MHRLQSQNPVRQVYIFLTLNSLIFSFDFTLQNDVKSPKSTRHSCPVMWSHSGGQDEIKTVELVIETTPANIDWSPMDKSNAGNRFIYSFVEPKSVFTAGQLKIVAVEFPHFNISQKYLTILNTDYAPIFFNAYLPF